MHFTFGSSYRLDARIQPAFPALALSVLHEISSHNGAFPVKRARVAVSQIVQTS